MEKKNFTKIRLAKLTDMPEIYKLSKNFREISGTNNSRYSDEVIYCKDEIAELIKDGKNNIWLVAEILKNKKAEIVGFLFAKLMSSSWCYIDIVGVKKQYRDQGVGTGLYAKLIEVCKKRKVSYLQALVDVKNKGGRQFWKNKGFKKGKTLIWYDREL